MRKLTALFLAILMIASVCSFYTSALSIGGVEAIDAVEKYGDGVKFLTEEDFKDDIAGNFTTNGNTGSVSWDTESGRLKLVSTANMITDITAIDKKLVNYTITADLYMATSGKKFGLGLNSNQTWSQSTYMQAQAGSADVWYNNVGVGNLKSTANETVDAGEKITMKIVVSETHALFTYEINGFVYAWATGNGYVSGTGIALDNLGKTFGTGSPFFNQHGSTTLYVDNLTAWTGTSALKSDAVELYGNGIAILDEDDYKSDIANNFTTFGQGGTVSWDADTGRLKLVAGTNPMITDIVSIPKELVNYTITADLYMATSGKKFGLGLNSNHTWSQSTYIQAQAGSADVWYNNVGVGNLKSTANETVDVNERITMKIVVSKTHAFFTYELNGTVYEWNTGNEYVSGTGIALDKLGQAFGTGSPFFNQHGGSTLYVDNLTAWAGTGEMIDITTDDGDGINEPALYGAQIRSNTDGSYDIRFISTIDSVDKYVEVGYIFNLSTWTGSATVRDNISRSGYVIKNSQFAYTAINYTDSNGRIQQKNAPDGKFFFAISVTGIELTDKTDYMSGQVTPYAVDNNGIKHIGTTYTVTVVDGNTCSFEKVTNG